MPCVEDNVSECANRRNRFCAALRKSLGLRLLRDHTMLSEHGDHRLFESESATHALGAKRAKPKIG